MAHVEGRVFVDRTLPAQTPRRARGTLRRDGPRAGGPARRRLAGGGPGRIRPAGRLRPAAGGSLVEAVSRRAGGRGAGDGPPHRVAGGARARGRRKCHRPRRLPARQSDLRARRAARGGGARLGAFDDRPPDRRPRLLLPLLAPAAGVRGTARPRHPRPAERSGVRRRLLPPPRSRVRCRISSSSSPSRCSAGRRSPRACIVARSTATPPTPPACRRARSSRPSPRSAGGSHRATAEPMPSLRGATRRSSRAWIATSAKRPARDDGRYSEDLRQEASTTKMRITRIETLRLDEFPNLLWVMVHTDAGLVGLGETFFAARTVEAAMHETVAPAVLGADAFAIERHMRRLLLNYVGFKSTGAEMRAASAFDIALWDILGQATGQPVYNLLGGRCRDRIRAYNTCAGTRYVRARPTQSTEDWGVGEAEGPYRGSRRLPPPRRRPRREPARGGLSRHEDLAVRPRRRGVGRHRHLRRRPQARARTVRENPQARRRPHRHPCRVPRPLDAARGAAHRARAGAVQTPTGRKTRSR